MSATATHTPTIAHLLGDAKQRVIDELHKRMRAQGYDDIRPSHGCVFRFIDGVEGSRLTDLAESAGMTKQSLGELVSDLEALGYVERVPDPGDGRAKIVRLTARGRESREAAMRTFAAIEADWAERLGEERVAQLRETLSELAGR